MYCHNCGCNMPEDTQFCPNCGIPNKSGGNRVRRTVLMTRLGITTTVLGAATYLAGLISPIVLTLITGYILLLEDDKELKADALKSCVLYLFFFGMEKIMTVIQCIVEIFGTMVNWFANVYIHVPLSLDVIYFNILNIFQIIIVLAAVCMTLKGRGFYLKKVDEFVEMHF